MAPMLRRCVAIAVAVAAADAQRVKMSHPPVQEWTRQGSVNCGGHFAESCRVCEAGNGEVWCNGDCVWVFGSCDFNSSWTGLKLNFEKKILDHWRVWACMWLIIFWLLFCYAFQYKKRVVNEYPKGIAGEAEDAESEEEEEERRKEREFGLFDIADKPHTCLWAFFCSPVLAAKNYHVAEVLPYWPSCAVLTCLLYSPLPCLAALVRAILSTKLQRRLKHKASCPEECLIGLCCFPCAVGRESMEVDEAEYMEVTCAFNVESIAPAAEEEDIMESKDRSCWQGTKATTVSTWDSAKTKTKSGWDSTKARAARTCGPNGEEGDAAESTGFWGSSKKAVENGAESAGEETKTMWTKVTEAMPKFGRSSTSEEGKADGL